MVAVASVKAQLLRGLTVFCGLAGNGLKVRKDRLSGSLQTIN